MNIVDLSEDLVPLYCVCLEDWSQEMQEAGTRKRDWYEAMRGRGLRVKLALDDAGTVGGMIQYAPIEESFASGKDLYFIFCIWVHGYKVGRGDFRKRGMGKALLQAAEDDARVLGAKGMAAWGLALPVWMRASWFRKRGYRVADRDGIRHLLWKPFASDAARPEWAKEQKRPPAVPGKVSVTSFVNGWCPAQNIACERAKRACAELGDRVAFTEIHTADAATFREWGITDGLFIDGKPVRFGPPPRFAKIKRQIERRARRLPSP